MDVTLSPEMEQVVQDLVQTGRFASPTEVFEAGIRQLVADEEFTEQDLADFEEADREIDAGQVHTVAELRREFLGK